MFIYSYPLSYIIMGEELIPPGSGFGGSNQRKLMIATIENILKTNLPMEKNKITAKIMYSTGLTEMKVRDYIKLFYRVGKIRKDEEDEDILTWCSKK